VSGGDFPYSNSYGVLPLKTEDGVRLIKYPAAKIHSPQKSIGRFA
jgi:hypothetical protein